MHGPQRAGYWSSAPGPNVGPQHQFLIAGHEYRVIQSFHDFDGDLHPVGERWTFRGSAFLPHDDGLSWFVSLDNVREWHIRMQWRDGEQGPVIDALSRYVEAV